MGVYTMDALNRRGYAMPAAVVPPVLGLNDDEIDSFPEPRTTDEDFGILEVSENNGAEVAKTSFVDECRLLVDGLANIRRAVQEGHAHDDPEARMVLDGLVAACDMTATTVSEEIFHDAEELEAASAVSV